MRLPAIHEESDCNRSSHRDPESWRVAGEMRAWLSVMGLEQLTPIFIEAGFDDLSALLLQARSRVPITRDLLRKIGVQLPGHQARILVRLERELPRPKQRALDTSARAAVSSNFLCCGRTVDAPSFSSPQATLSSRPNTPRHRCSLGEWLEQLRLRSQLILFHRSGYDDLDWMLAQM